MSPYDFAFNVFHIARFEEYINNNNFVDDFNEDDSVNMLISLDDIDELLNELELRGFHIMFEVPQIKNHLRYWYEQL